ncbi:hypothetical protein ACWEQC_17540 [Streptomyces shenzhenensis]
MHKKAITALFLFVAAAGAVMVTGCDAPWVAKPAPNDVITVSTLPPDDDRAVSEKAARSFLLARADDGTIYPLVDAIERVFGDWEKGSDRAFIATSLYGARATPENGKLIANAFANYTNSETGRGRVSVFDENGKLLYAGDF